jgi:hypothetical protein
VARVPAIAIAVVPTPSEVHARNAGRTERIVPPEIVDRHLARLAGLGADGPAITAALHAEGFDAVHVLDPGRPVEPRLAIERRPSGSPAR